MAEPVSWRSLARRQHHRGFPLVAAVILCGLLRALAAGQAPDADAGWHVFRYEVPSGQPQPRTVHLAGEFNNWSTTATPMELRNGVWTVRLKLSPGVHHYKFVLDGNRWVNDPSADPSLNEPDNYGGVNSGVLIGPDARRFPPPRPDHIHMPGVRFNPDSPSDLDVADATLLWVSFQAQAGDLTGARVLVRDEETGQAWQAQTLALMGEEMGFARWGGLVRVDDEPVRCVLELVDGGASVFVCARGVLDDAEAAKAAAFAVDMRPRFQTPAWAKHAVWYQIFPERFRNGDSANDPPNTQRWTSDWWSTLPGEAPGPENFYRGVGNVWNRWFGGDLQGLIEQLPYLRRLGVNAIYLNPIFEARSTHKYDTTTYLHIDDNFGFKGDIDALKGEVLTDPSTWRWTPTDKLFLKFLDEAHSQGFRVIIDGVFNHVGRDFGPFRDVLKKGRASRYADWFEITDWGQGGEPGKPGGIQWAAWDGPNGWLPAFKKNPETGLAHGPRELVLAVAQRWLAPEGDPSRGVDGFRLDVPQDIPPPFWVDFRKLVKRLKPEAIIIGEIWGEAQPWLRGDQFDAVMNYQFAMAAQAFFVNQRQQLQPSRFADRLQRLLSLYPFQVNLVQQNLFDSHDTDRLASMFVNPDRPYDGRNRIQDNGPDYSPAKPSPLDFQRMRQAVAFQMTFVGAPMIYYGDEAGMWSPDDPSNRQPMVWPDLEPYDRPEVTFDEELFAFYQRAIAIRRELTPLRLGMFRVLLADDGRNVLAFARELDGQAVCVAINRSDRAQQITVSPLPFDDGTQLVDYLDAQAVRLVPPGSDVIDARPTLQVLENGPRWTVRQQRMTLTLPPYSTAILAPQPQAER